MTGEMTWINEDGTDSNGDSYPLHAAIAKHIGGDLRPFDVYQGPYILGEGVKLWIIVDDIDDVFAHVYDERSDRVSEAFEAYGPYAEDDALFAVDELMASQPA